MPNRQLRQWRSLIRYRHHYGTETNADQEPDSRDPRPRRPDSPEGTSGLERGFSEHPGRTIQANRPSTSSMKLLPVE